MPKMRDMKMRHQTARHQSINQSINDEFLE